MEVSRVIAELLSKIQVMDSRLSNLRDYFENPHQHPVKIGGLDRNVDDFIANAIEIAARASQLFAYARGQTDAAPPPLDSRAISGGFHTCGLDQLKETAIWNVLAARYP